MSASNTAGPQLSSEAAAAEGPAKSKNADKTKAERLAKLVRFQQKQATKVKCLTLGWAVSHTRCAFHGARCSTPRAGLKGEPTRIRVGGVRGLFEAESLLTTRHALFVDNDIGSPNPRRLPKRRKRRSQRLKRPRSLNTRTPLQLVKKRTCPSLSPPATILMPSNRQGTNGARRSSLSWPGWQAQTRRPVRCPRTTAQHHRILAYWPGSHRRHTGLADPM
ncbi:hypothetical protein BC938DRAFT_478638, partial [Jimgerdemannia flammicorona]